MSLVSANVPQKKHEGGPKVVEENKQTKGEVPVASLVLPKYAAVGSQYCTVMT